MARRVSHAQTNSIFPKLYVYVKFSISQSYLIYSQKGLTLTFALRQAGVNVVT
jgi:hypothetical protein